MLIKVTQEDIDNGKRDNIRCCPIALACIRAGIKNPLVNWSGIFDCPDPIPRTMLALKSSNTRVGFHTSNSDLFMSNFDDGRDVQPFEFELKI